MSDREGVTHGAVTSRERISPGSEELDGQPESDSRTDGVGKSEVGPSDAESRRGLSVEEGVGNEQASEKDLNSDNDHGEPSNGAEPGVASEGTQAGVGQVIPSKMFENLILPTSARLNPTVGSYLEKLSPTALKGFQKRFFRLNLTDNALLYWREEPTFPDQQPAGCINLSSVIAIHIEDALNFVIRTFGRDYCLRAMSPGDKDIWLESICMVVNAVAHRETLKDASNHYNFSKVLLDSSSSIQTYLTEALKTQRKVRWVKEDRVPLTFSLRGKKMFLGAKGIQSSLARLWFDYVFDVRYLCPSSLPHLSLYQEVPGGGSFVGFVQGRSQVSSCSSHPSPSSLSFKASARRGGAGGGGGGFGSSWRQCHKTRSSSYCTSTGSLGLSSLSQQSTIQSSSSSPSMGGLRHEDYVVPIMGVAAGGAFGARRYAAGSFYGTYRGQSLKISKSMIGSELGSMGSRTKTLRDSGGFSAIHQTPASEGLRSSEANVQTFTRMRSHLDNVLFGTIYVEIGPLPTLEHIVQNVLLAQGAFGDSGDCSSSSLSSSSNPNPPLSSLQKFFALLISSRPIANNEAFFPLPNNFSLKTHDTSQSLNSRLGYSSSAQTSAPGGPCTGSGHGSGLAGGDRRETESLPFNIQLDCLYLFSPEYDSSPPLYVIELDNIQLSSKIREVQTGFQFRLQVPLGNILASLRDPSVGFRGHEETSGSPEEDGEGQRGEVVTINPPASEGGGGPLEGDCPGGGTSRDKGEREEEIQERSGQSGSAAEDMATVSERDQDVGSQVASLSEGGGASSSHHLGELKQGLDSETNNTTTVPSPVCGEGGSGQSSHQRDTRYSSITELVCDPSLPLYGLGGSGDKGGGEGSSCHRELFRSVSSMHAALAGCGVVPRGGGTGGISMEKASVRIISIFGPDAEIWREALIASCRARHAAKENMLRTLHDELRAFDSIPKELLYENTIRLFCRTLVYICASYGVVTSGSSEEFGVMMNSSNYRRISPMVGGGALRGAGDGGGFGPGMPQLGVGPGGAEGGSGGGWTSSWIKRLVGQISSSFVTIPVLRILQGLDVFNSTGRDLLQASIRVVSNPRVDVLRFVHDRYLVPILMVIQECLTRRGDLMREVDILLVLEFLVDLRQTYESFGIYDSKFKYLVLDFSSLYIKRLIQPYYGKIFRSIHNTCYLGKTFRDKESGTLHISLFSELFSSLYSMINLFTSLRFYHYSAEVRSVLFMAVQHSLLQYQLAIRDVVLHNLCSITELNPEKQRFFFQDDCRRREGGARSQGHSQDGCYWCCYNSHQRPWSARETDYSKITISSEVICGLLNGIEYCICKCDELDLLMERWNPFVLYKFEQEYFRDFFLDGMVPGGNTGGGGIGTRLTTAQSVEVIDSSTIGGGMSMADSGAGSNSNSNSNSNLGVGSGALLTGGDLGVGGGVNNNTTSSLSSSGVVVTANSSLTLGGAGGGAGGAGTGGVGGIPIVLSNPSCSSQVGLPTMKSMGNNNHHLCYNNTSMVTGSSASPSLMSMSNSGIISGGLGLTMSSNTNTTGTNTNTNTTTPTPPQSQSQSQLQASQITSNNTPVPSQVMMVSSLNDEKIQDMIDVYAPRNLRSEARRFSLLFHISKMYLSIKTCKEWYRRVQSHFLGALKGNVSSVTVPNQDKGFMKYVLSLDMDTLLKEALRPQLRVLKISLKKSLFSKVSKLVLEYVVRVYTESLLLFAFFYSVIHADSSNCGDAAVAAVEEEGERVDDISNMNMIAAKLLEDWDVIGHFFQDCMSEEATRECLIILADLHDILTSPRPTLYEKCLEFQEKYRIFDLSLFIKIVLILRFEVKLARFPNKSNQQIGTDITGTNDDHDHMGLYLKEEDNNNNISSSGGGCCTTSSQLSSLDLDGGRILMVPLIPESAAVTVPSEIFGDEVNQIILEGISEINLVSCSVSFNGLDARGNKDEGMSCLTVEGSGVSGDHLVDDDLEGGGIMAITAWTKDNLYYWNKQMNIVRSVSSSLHTGGAGGGAGFSPSLGNNAFGDHLHSFPLRKVTSLSLDEMNLIVGDTCSSHHQFMGGGGDVSDNTGFDGANPILTVPGSSSNANSLVSSGGGNNAGLLSTSSISSSSMVISGNHLTSTISSSSMTSGSIPLGSGGAPTIMGCSAAGSGAGANITGGGVSNNTSGNSNSSITGGGMGGASSNPSAAASASTSSSTAATASTSSSAVAPASTVSVVTAASGTGANSTSGGAGATGGGSSASSGMKRSFSLEFLSQITGDDNTLEKGMISSFLLGRTCLYSPISTLHLSGLRGGSSILQDFLDRDEKWWESIYGYYSQIYIPDYLFGMISTRLSMDTGSEEYLRHSGRRQEQEQQEGGGASFSPLNTKTTNALGSSQHSTAQEGGEGTSASRLDERSDEKEGSDVVTDMAVRMYQRYTHLSRILTNTFYGRYISDTGSYLQPASTESAALDYLMGQRQVSLLDLGYRGGTGGVYYPVCSCQNLVTSFSKPRQSMVHFKYYSNNGSNDNSRDWQPGYMVIEDFSIHIYDNVYKQRLLDVLAIRPNHDGERITSICIDPQDLSRTGFIIFWGERELDGLNAGTSAGTTSINTGNSVISSNNTASITGVGGAGAGAAGVSVGTCTTGVGSGSVGVGSSAASACNPGGGNSASVAGTAGNSGGGGAAVGLTNTTNIHKTSNLSPTLQNMTNSGSSSSSSSNLLQVNNVAGGSLSNTNATTNSMVNISNSLNPDPHSSNITQQSYNISIYSTDVKNCSLHVKAPTPQLAAMWVSEIDILIQRSRSNWGVGFLESFERKRFCQYMKVE